MGQPDLEIICIYNKDDVLQEFLLAGLARQDCPYKLTLYQGSQSDAGAAAIFNRLIRQSDARYILCCHQDVTFLKPDVLTKIVRHLEHHPGHIVGAAGADLANGRLQVFGNLQEGREPHFRLAEIHRPRRVRSLDECLFAFDRSVYDRVQMDEKLLTDWHLYAVEFCYAARRQGFRVVALPLAVWHLSEGLAGREYYRQLERVRKKYRKLKVRYLVAPGIKWNTRLPAICCYHYKKMRWSITNGKYKIKQRFAR